MSQYQFLDRRFQEYNVALIKALQDLAAQLEAEKCIQQGEFVRVMLDFLLEVEVKNQRDLAAIEEDIKKSLLLD
ncbi:hypothetical protein NIES267_03120 [Calothrix parasitica NIES-267]|uniref:Uncharacterized protein n=1 Tax=Calothrix parasitica NIES-267 TaxID=1973488 RepID=A0A1Z4LHZ4_9CYAN|nr:hypothetical protein NIES267_03120 [Calothrix parasitica NIES-267]